jgi:hypothetical protein
VTGTLYVVGVPGAGKTTALAEARQLRGWTLVADEKLPLRHQLWATPGGQWVHQLGWNRPDGLSGTDTLSFSVQPVIAAWLASVDAPAKLVGEGDRLATDGFFQAAADAGDLRLLWIDTPEVVARERVTGRGSVQSLAWWRGRATKVARLVERWPAERIDGCQAPERVAARVAQWLP